MELNDFDIDLKKKSTAFKGIQNKKNWTTTNGITSKLSWYIEV